jgi:dolichol-phosphate mannosyltransferase
MRGVTVIVPTYREAENIPELICRLTSVRDAGCDLDLLLMDDDSQDGSEQLVAQCGVAWVQLVTRKTGRGLSGAILDGTRRSNREIIVVMDADLSHPPERIPDLIEMIKKGADVAVGSRFVEGGSTADNWGPLRWFNSRVASFLALPLTTVQDPMSGFFAVRRSTLDRSGDLQPLGYKILLEIIVKCKCRWVAEVPIHFDNRHFGSSKLTLREQLNYIRHLRRLYMFRYGTWSHLAQFLVVGVSGAAVNLVILTVLLSERVGERKSVAVAILISMIGNFLLNRRFSFSYARRESMTRQLVKFVLACSLGAVVNYAVTTRLLSIVSYSQFASITGILVGTVFNFTASRFLVFRSKHVIP